MEFIDANHYNIRGGTKSPHNESTDIILVASSFLIVCYLWCSARFAKKEERAYLD